MIQNNARLYFGDQPVSRAYLGSVLIYQSLHPKTQQLLDHAGANGWTEPSNVNLLNTLVGDMDSIDFYDYVDAYWLYSTDASTNFRRMNIVDVNRNLNDFFGGLDVAINGIKGNASNAYIDTNYNYNSPFTGKKFALNDASIGLVKVEQYNSGGGNIIGMTGSFNQNLSQTDSAANRLNATANLSSAVDFTPLGLKNISRTSSTDLELTDRNNVYNRTQNSSGVPDNNMLLFRANTQYTNARIACAWVGRAIPNTVLQNFRTVFNNYLSGLGQTPLT